MYRSLLVAYEPTANGRSALDHAFALARESDAALTIAAIAPQERTDVGCTHCRATAARWNDEMRAVARHHLDELAAQLDQPPANVRYLTACGPAAGILAQAAEHYDIDLIVLPWRRGARLRSLLRINLADRLERSERWDVRVAPRAARRRRSTGGRIGGKPPHRPNVRPATR